MTGLIVDIGRSLVRSGINLLGIANAHLDPTHLGSVHHAVQALSDGGALKIAFPDLTQKPWARRLTDEFKSGACHAGQFETSIVLASRPDLVDEDLRKSLEPNPVSLSVAIRDGKTSFKAAGGDQAYFGDPSEATAAEGTETITILGKILADAVRERSDLEL
jgi:creatinine amidohydrolase